MLELMQYCRRTIVPIVIACLLIGCVTDPADDDAGFYDSEMPPSDTHPDGGGRIDTGTEDPISCGDTDTVPDWVEIQGGTYYMGAVQETGIDFAQPMHQVTIPSFSVWRTEVTTAQYRTCIRAGACNWPAMTHFLCNAEKKDRLDHPINCVSWQNALEFCTFVGGRLLNESEWEYVARSGGRNYFYPWGNDPPTCENTVMDSPEQGCSTLTTFPVCSKPLGNTEQGLCDMVGNVHEWVDDWFVPSYAYTYQSELFYAPDDGSSWELGEWAWGDQNADPCRVMRGFGIGSRGEFGSRIRVYHPPHFFFPGLGIRCAKD